MHRAGQKRPVSVRAIPATPSVTTLKVVAFADEPDSATPVDVELLPGVTAVPLIRSDATNSRETRLRALESAIQQRIESRLLGRVRNLLVRAVDGVVILEGECTTFHTKQLAQHAAMGVLDDEQLENAIVVRMH
jgi:hypothetical protein